MTRGLLLVASWLETLAFALALHPAGDFLVAPNARRLELSADLTIGTSEGYKVNRVALRVIAVGVVGYERLVTLIN